MTPSLLNITPELSASVATRILAAKALLADIAHNFAPATFANSLGAEDMVLTDLILKSRLPITIFSLDTGRLPPETYDLIGAVDKHYGHRLTIFFPRADDVETYVRNQGINAFRDSVTLRKACCAIRKVEPLQRALAGKRAWITGQRAQQAATRDGLPLREYDASNGLEKFNPLAEWSEKEIWTYIKQNAVPYNALHDRFYPSIGCAPCTRAVALGEDVRAGRWWWESPESKECGLHVKG
ncbi:MAG: phosphoadenylyl-sulfate reductase [Dechloromonas sp.]|uniref:Adenosine 5'-phosphosulfate reductase n=1 Tax=Candidatus Dechloromonas phosphorivorans TaxID=2899244 RepID=A0A9D7LR14_9RHOO|nr:phosphoadenylyl-sulfate reductase [Candidatus Dechloromonas phosphorivorans]